MDTNIGMCIYSLTKEGKWAFILQDEKETSYTWEDDTYIYTLNPKYYTLEQVYDWEIKLTSSSYICGPLLYTVMKNKTTSLIRVCKSPQSTGVILTFVYANKITQCNVDEFSIPHLLPQLANLVSIL